MRILVCLLLAGALSARAETVVTVLATTDLHGNLMPWDYFTAKPAERGLAKIATLIRAERKLNPNALLLDCGDTIQGTPLEGVFQHWRRTGDLPAGLHPAPAYTADPMMLAMNELRYDAMTVGNHEFNFGLPNLKRSREEAKFPWLAANIRTAPGFSLKPFAPYLVKTVSGVKVAIIGLTTPAVPGWEKPENFKGLTFINGREAVAEAVAELKTRERPDVIILAAHAGLERDLKTGQLRAGEDGRENMIHEIASTIPGIDVIVFGHTHQQLASHRIGDVLLVQPRNWGMSLAKVEIKLERDAGKRWRILSKDSALLPATAEVPADPAIVRIAEPYHRAAEQYLDRPITEVSRSLDANLSRVQDTALIDAIHQVQLHYAKADVSFAAAFNAGARLPAGKVTVRQIAALYIYDNELYAIEGTGRMVREALENAVRYYQSCRDAACSGGTSINRSVLGFNYDMAQGVSYDVDLTRPEGSRIRNLMFKGKPLSDDRKLRIAVNNYRAGGSGGYGMFKGAPVVWRSYREIRELMIEYYREHPLPLEADNNWRVQPPAAGESLREEAQRESRRPLTR